MTSETQAASPNEKVTWTNIASRAWCIVKRVLALLAVAVTVYVTVGCVIFGAWWYGLLWADQFNWHYVADGLKILLDEYFPIVIGIVIAVFVVLVLGSVFKTPLFRFVDRFAGRIVLVTSLLLLSTSLVVYHTEKAQYDLLHAVESGILTIDNLQKSLAASNSPPHIVPPVDFQYIDKSRVDELYNQIEPDLIEKERTVAKTRSAKGKLGAGVNGIATGE